jgi:uncharacterized protein YndB with AHSA1/START domain
MEKREFKITINAPANRVWYVLWNDSTYRQWTNAFAQGSYAVSDWQEGSEISFLSPKGDGMYAVIEKKEEGKHIVFRHQGELKDGKKITPVEWTGSTEAYTLQEQDRITTLTVSMDITDSFLEYFTGVWPKALQKVKELAESPEMKSVTVEVTVNAPIEAVWKCWTEPADIVHWNNASDDWHTPKAENDIRPVVSCFGAWRQRMAVLGLILEGNTRR